MWLILTFIWKFEKLLLKIFSVIFSSNIKACHPIFYGCYDWHSAVHSHWLLAKVRRIFFIKCFITYLKLAVEYLYNWFFLWCFLCWLCPFTRGIYLAKKWKMRQWGKRRKKGKEKGKMKKGNKKEEKEKGESDFFLLIYGTLLLIIVY